ncbi:ANTAR domain-containing protein [Streptomyces sp. NPDC003077]|uniref:ANTAR domain-containing protein n=1 Tax=Streptomyces sp. NPDC003077 TaxID=3154443 RepID=UPI0033A6CBBD
MPDPGREISERMAAVLATSRSGAGASRLPPAECAAALGLNGVTASLRTPAHTTELVWYAPADRTGLTLDDIQYTLGQGPTPDTARTGRSVAEPDLTATPASRWPAFLPAALSAGAGAVFTFPLRVGAMQLGVLTGYRTVPGPLTDQQDRDARALTRVLSQFLLRRPHSAAFAPLGPMELYRAELHQATGALAARLSIPLDQALLRLRAHAYRHDRPLMDVARDVLIHSATLEDND